MTSAPLSPTTPRSARTSRRARRPSRTWSGSQHHARIVLVGDQRPPRGVPLDETALEVDRLDALLDQEARGVRRAAADAAHDEGLVGLWELGVLRAQLHER